MKRLAAMAILFCLLAISCSDSGDGDMSATSGLASGSCMAADPDCADGAAVGPALELPSAVALSGPDLEAPLHVSFGGFFYSDGTVSQLCSALAESFPPQCSSVVINLEASLDVVLNHVAESFGNPEDAKINIDQGIYWTDDWINLSGILAANRLVLE